VLERAALEAAWGTRLVSGEPLAQDGSPAREHNVVYNWLLHEALLVTWWAWLEWLVRVTSWVASLTEHPHVRGWCLERVSDPHICCRYNGEGFKFMGRGKRVRNFKPINPVLTDAQLAGM